MSACSYFQYCNSANKSAKRKYLNQIDGDARLKHQRNLANQRERKRMMLINQGFELLRTRLPISKLRNKFEHRSVQKVKKCRLTKVDILRLTIEYIKHLTKLLEYDGSAVSFEGLKEIKIASNIGCIKARNSCRQPRRFKLPEEIARESSEQESPSKRRIYSGRAILWVPEKH